MSSITPITNVFAARPAQPVQRTQTAQPAKPTFGLATASFTAKGPQSSQPLTPKLDMAKPAGQRLNYLA